MITVNRGRITYYIKDESVIAAINNLQYLAFTVYPLQNRTPFYNFRKKLLKSKENEYDTPLELMKLSMKHNLKAVAGTKPKEAE
jgi:hypothetical protein